MFLGVDDLRRDRQWLRLSTAELATRAGIRPCLLSAIETGRRSLSSENRQALSRALADRRQELSREREVRDGKDADGRSGNAAA